MMGGRVKYSNNNEIGGCNPVIFRAALQELQCGFLQWGNAELKQLSVADAVFEYHHVAA